MTIIIINVVLFYFTVKIQNIKWEWDEFTKNSHKIHTTPLHCPMELKTVSAVTRGLQACITGREHLYFIISITKKKKKKYDNNIEVINEMSLIA